MKQLNRYYRCAKISERKTRQIIRYFALDLTANKTAELVAMTHGSVNRIFLKIRTCIAQEAERASPFSSCEVEVDESYFSARGESKASVGAEQAARPKSLASSKATGRFILRLSRIVRKRRCKRLFAGASRSMRSSIQTNGAAMTDWLTSVTANIFALITVPTNL